MAAGSFLFENKLRPGCYIQIKGVPKASSDMSERGMVAILMNSDSGDLITELSANDILTGASTSKGFPLTAFTDTKSILNYVYPYVNKIIIGRLNNGGLKASVYVLGDSETTASLFAQANFAGLAGNKLSVIIVAEATGEGKYKGAGFFVRTSMDGEVVDEQNVKLPSEIKSNDYLTFTVGETLAALSAVAAKDLAGGTNGTESDSNLTKILDKLSTMSWNTLGFCGKDENRTVIETYIYNLRENKGKYRQAVVFDHESADYEGVISPFQAFAVDDDDVDWLEEAETAEAQAALALRQKFVVAFVAAITAGADVYVSNTYRKVPSNVTAVVPIYDEDEDVEGLLRTGCFTFTHNSESEIVVEKDINTLHTYTQKRTKPFSKNRVIRALDELANSKILAFERYFIGKINNDDMGRTLLYSQIETIIKNLANLGAFSDSDYSIVIEAGNEVDQVRSYEQVRPIDSMEQLYSYVTVLG